MSFVTAIRDYVELLNHLSDSVLNAQASSEGVSLPLIPFTEFISETLRYIFKTFQYIFVYIVTFRWVRDFSLLPIIIPQLSSSIFRETSFLDNPTSPIFGFLEMPLLKQNSFLLGIFNSLFFTVPFSIIHIVSLRRLYIKGIPSATFSIGGYLVGQWLFLACSIFGLRHFLIPLLTFEPLTYIVGLILIFRLVYSMTQENLRELAGWKQPQYLNFFLVSFILAWCEQTAIFQYLGNLSFSPTTSILEIMSTSTNFLSHFSYLLGIGVGSTFFTFLWGAFFLQIKNLFIRYTPLFLSSFVQTINTGSFILAIGLSLSSIPFYGLDYLSTAPFGFVSQDKVFKNTVFDQYNLKDSVLGLGISSQFDSIDMDVSPFDRGRYLVYPERTIPFAFEDLNYRGEFEWTTRYDKVSTVTDSRAGFLSLAKLFKKQKTEELQKPTRIQEERENTLGIKSNFGREAIVSSTTLETSNPRFQEWYAVDPTTAAEDARPLESIFADIQDTSFPLDFLRTNSLEPGKIDLKIKQKYYSNPLYKNLLALDIDLFINRQPKTFRLNGEQELDLYTKRRMLTAYYDSLRDYAQLPYANDFETFFQGSKSFSNKVYNQQFKGTLRSICRLFSLTTDPESNLVDHKQKQVVLKYDQPLYVFSETQKFSPYHEEIQSKINVSNSSLKVKVSPFVTDVTAGPLYAGWNEKTRKLIITNKFFPRNVAGYEMTIPTRNEKQFVQSFSNLESTQLVSHDFEKKKIQFTIWPLSNKLLSNGKDKTTVPYITLYTPQSEFEAPGDPRFDTLSTLPANWETRNRRSNIGLGKTYDNIFDYLAPQRGGFLWPGNAKPNFKLI